MPPRRASAANTSVAPTARRVVGAASATRGGCAALGGPKRDLDIADMVRRLRADVKAYADAAMFELRERGYGGVFQQLVACIISIRTRDEVSLPVSVALLERAPTAQAMAALGVDGITRLIASSTLAEAKASHRCAAEVLALPRARMLPAGGGDAMRVITPGPDSAPGAGAWRLTRRRGARRGAAAGTPALPFFSSPCSAPPRDAPWRENDRGPYPARAISRGIPFPRSCS